MESIISLSRSAKPSMLTAKSENSMGSTHNRAAPKRGDPRMSLRPALAA